MNTKYINGKILKTYKAKLIKENHLPKEMYNIISVQADTKYGYFIVTTKIYHHEIITTHSFKDVDYIELYEDGIKTPVEVIKRV